MKRNWPNAEGIASGREKTGFYLNLGLVQSPSVTRVVLTARRGRSTQSAPASTKEFRALRIHRKKKPNSKILPSGKSGLFQFSA